MQPEFLNSGNDNDGVLGFPVQNNAHLIVCRHRLRLGTEMRLPLVRKCATTLAVHGVS